MNPPFRLRVFWQNDFPLRGERGVPLSFLVVFDEFPNDGATKKGINKPPEKCYYPPSLPPSHHLWHSPSKGNITFSSPQVLIHFTYISKLNQPFLFSWRRQSLSLSADFSSKLRNLVITKDNGNGAWSGLTCKTVLEWAYKFVKLHICHGVYHVCPSDSFPGKYIVDGLDTGFQR